MINKCYATVKILWGLKEKMPYNRLGEMTWLCPTETLRKSPAHSLCTAKWEDPNQSPCNLSFPVVSCLHEWHHHPSIKVRNLGLILAHSFCHVLSLVHCRHTDWPPEYISTLFSLHQFPPPVLLFNFLFIITTRVVEKWSVKVTGCCGLNVCVFPKFMC